LDELDDAPKKSKKDKKKAKAVVAAVAKEEVVDESTMWKGKAASFFVM
jgi:hypothetical protein